jgi:hypothetical protein
MAYGTASLPVTAYCDVCKRETAWGSLSNECTEHDDRHIVRYSTVSGDRYLASDPLDWPAAQALWQVLDHQRVDGQLPWVRWFEVRSASDPTNPTLKVPARPHRSSDHPENLRHKGVTLKAGQRVYTFQCRFCGRVYQGSGLGVGSHRSACRAR